MLFKFETVVLAIVGGLLSFASPSFADTDNSSDFNTCKSMLPTPPATNMDSFNACVKTIGDQKIKVAGAGKNKDNSEKCNDAMKDFSKAKGKLAGACGRFGMSSSAEECAKQIRKCGTKDDKPEGVICPVTDATDLNKKQDDAQKVSDDIEKLKTDMGKFDDKAAELTQQANQQQSDINKEMSKMQSQFTQEEAKRRSAMQQGMNQQQKQAIAQMQQMQQEYDKMSMQLKMVPTQIAQAQVQNYDQVVTKLRLDCHSQALGIVQQKQAATLAKISKSSYNIGSLNNVIRTLGMTDEQRYEVMAMYYEKKCLNDSAYITQVNLAYKTAKIARQALQAQQDGMIQQQSRMIQMMNTAQQQAGLDKNQAYQQAQQDEAAARQSFVTEQSSLQQQLATAQNSMQAKVQALNNQKQQMGSQIQQKNSYLEGKQQIVKLAQDLSGGKNRTAKDAEDVNNARGDAEGEADAVQSACRCKVKSVDETGCKTSSNFIAASSGAETSSVEDGDSEVAAGEESEDKPRAPAAAAPASADPFSAAPAPRGSIRPSAPANSNWSTDPTTTFGTGVTN